MFLRIYLDFLFCVATAFISAQKTIFLIRLDNRTWEWCDNRTTIVTFSMGTQKLYIQVSIGVRTAYTSIFEDPEGFTVRCPAKTDANWIAFWRWLNGIAAH